VTSETPSSELDDVADREELRDRFTMLLQELRVALPGVQVLSAFLLTAPFSQRFGELDRWGRRVYAIALTTSMLSVMFLLAPTLLHRIGPRTARSARLVWSVRMLTIGLACVAIALVSALWGVTRFVFGTPTAWCITAPVGAVLVITWIVVPLSLRAKHRQSGA